MVSPSGSSGSTAILDKPDLLERLILELEEDPVDQEETPERTPKGYLTLVETPTLFGTYGLLISTNIRENNGVKMFSDNYLFRGIGDFIESPLYKPKMVTSVQMPELKSGDTPLHILVINYNDKNPYRAASIDPLVTCELSADERNQFERNLRYRRHVGLVNEMLSIIGAAGFPGIEFVEGKLNTPTTYASSPLPK